MRAARWEERDAPMLRLEGQRDGQTTTKKEKERVRSVGRTCIDRQAGLRQSPIESLPSSEHGANSAPCHIWFLTCAT